MNRYLSALLALCLLVLGGLAQAQGQYVTYLHPDIQGSPLVATDEQGALQWHEDYEPWGARQVKEANSASNARGGKVWYTGKEEEADLGLYYYGARWYAPDVGQFYSTDPATVTLDNPRSFSRYAYANNNPIAYVDPDGRFPLLVAVVLLMPVAIYTNDANAPGPGDPIYNKNPVVPFLNAVPGLGMAKPLINVVGGGSKVQEKGSNNRPDHIVTRDGVVVPASPEKLRASLNGAGYTGKDVKNPSGTETGTIHNIPQMKMDIRVMNGGEHHPPRAVTTRQGTSQPVNPKDGSNFGNIPKSEQREKSHLKF